MVSSSLQLVLATMSHLVRLCVLAAVICFGRGLCVFADTVPERGTLIVAELGDGGIVIQCSVYADVNRTDRKITQWTLEDRDRELGIIDQEFPQFNITGDTRNGTLFTSFQNVITIVNFTADLIGKTLFCGSGGMLQTASFPLRLYMRLSPPTLLTILSNVSGPTNIVICWQAPLMMGTPPVSLYEVIFTDPENRMRTAHTEAAVTKLDVTGLLPGTTYVFSVVAISAVEYGVGGRSDPSETVEGTTTTMLVPPSQPTDLKILANDSGPTNIVICWQAPLMMGTPPVSLYEVTFTDPENRTQTAHTETAVTKLDVTGLLPGTTYVFSVVAISAVEYGVGGRSDPSETVEGTTTDIDSKVPSTTTTTTTGLITAVLCSVVFFVVGVLSTLLVVYCITRTKCSSVSSSSTEPESPLYEEVATATTKPTAVELDEISVYESVS